VKRETWVYTPVSYSGIYSFKYLPRAPSSWLIFLRVFTVLSIHREDSTSNDLSLLRWRGGSVQTPDVEGSCWGDPGYPHERNSDTVACCAGYHQFPLQRVRGIKSADFSAMTNFTSAAYWTICCASTSFVNGLSRWGRFWERKHLNVHNQHQWA
jgi:hypothetical protein